MKITKTQNIVLALVIVASTAVAQNVKQTNKQNQMAMNETTMNTYVIEREIPDAGNFNAEELQGISRTSCNVLKDLGPTIEWVHSYVTGNKIFCVYRAENEDILRIHAEKGGFPINVINKVSTVIRPATATAPLKEILR